MAFSNFCIRAIVLRSEKFIQKFRLYIEAHLDDNDMTVETISPSDL